VSGSIKQQVLKLFMAFSIGRTFSMRELSCSVMLALDIKPISANDNIEGYWIEGHDEPTFFPGRSAIVKYRTPHRNVIQIGSFGILHPEVLRNFDISYPGSAVELNLEPFL
jgi:phenylalanyl-tRNA synthetase beta chain